MYLIKQITLQGWETIGKTLTELDAEIALSREDLFPPYVLGYKTKRKYKIEEE